MVNFLGKSLAGFFATKVSRKESLKTYSLVFSLEGARADVVGVLVEHQRGEKPKILSSFHGSGKLFEVRGGLPLDGEERLAVALRYLLKSYGGTLPSGTRVICILPPSCYESKISTTNFSSEKSVPVSSELIQELRVSEGAWPASSEVVADKILSVQINDYETANPVGRSGRTLKVHCFRAASPKEVISRIRRALGGRFDYPILLEPSALVYFVTLRNLFPEVKNFVAVEISRALTEVSLVENSLLKGSYSFPLGSDALRMEAGGGSLTVGDSALNATRFQKNLDQVIFRWAREFNLALARLEEGGFLPKSFYILGDLAARRFVSAFNTSPRSGLVRLGEGSQIKFISNKDLNSHLSAPEGEQVDLATSLGALYAESTLS